MKDTVKLEASPREVTGKKTRFLRRQGVTPANVFGRGLASTALQVDSKQLRQVLGKVGTSQLISLKVKGQSEPKNVLVRDIQISPLSREVLHVDLYQVSLTERMRLDIPVTLTGESFAVKKLGGILFQALDKVNIECLPADIPPTIEVDISSLSELGMSIHVSELKLGDAVTVLDDPEDVIVSVLTPAAEESKLEAAAAAAAPAEGEAAAEGEKAETKEK